VIAKEQTTMGLFFSKPTTERAVAEEKLHKSGFRSADIPPGVAAYRVDGDKRVRYSHDVIGPKDKIRRKAAGLDDD
jgi:hypothetical protein